MTTLYEPCVGIIADMPMAEYQARPEVSKHDLDLIHKAPFAYRYAKDNPTEESEEMGLGSLAHLAILEPDEVSKQIVMLPESRPNRPMAKQLAMPVEKRTEAATKSIEFWEKWDREAEGKFTVTPEKMAIVQGMHASLMAHDSIRQIITMTGMREASMFWKMHDVECRARPDIIGDGVIVDLKTTGDCSREAFSREIFKMRYQAQAAFYLDGAKSLGLDIKQFLFVAVETKAPFLCAYYYASPDMIEWGRIENQRDLWTYKKCADENRWPGVKCDPNEPINLPSWAS